MVARDYRKRIEFWQQMIDHISGEWSKKRNAPAYPWSGREFRALRGLSVNYRPWGIMALFDEYLRRENPYAKINGFSVQEFIRELPSLVDSPSWKVRAKEYEDSLYASVKQRSFAEFLA